ncbi:hypothetical protein DIURU_003880 [Diutina rugosa]|uniref:Uncharacterized protein n=1 Tax=Diutina rugosa TaxID=5481 RepID=A0A642UJU7_DIURU|nr:uncharacterized protein DIURU_003880 [Diutina rugosa]KAA8900299.1 hypothetical protein DIURU_003880 [Diutina rugosa]
MSPPRSPSASPAPSYHHDTKPEPDVALASAIESLGAHQQATDATVEALADTVNRLQVAWDCSRDLQSEAATPSVTATWSHVEDVNGDNEANEAGTVVSDVLCEFIRFHLPVNGQVRHWKQFIEAVSGRATEIGVPPRKVNGSMNTMVSIPLFEQLQIHHTFSGDDYNDDFDSLQKKLDERLAGDHDKFRQAYHHAALKDASCWPRFTQFVSTLPQTLPYEYTSEDWYAMTQVLLPYEQWPPSFRRHYEYEILLYMTVMFKRNWSLQSHEVITMLEKFTKPLPERKRSSKRSPRD